MTQEDRPVPTWFEDAKLGIFIHWGAYSVPGWAPTRGGIWESQGDLGASPYAEWYRNSMRADGSPTQAWHARTWGADFPYERFADLFNASLPGWAPDSWADLFAESGARYVVLGSKHHDGFLLWPSAQRNPNAPDYVAARDIVGELSASVRARGLRMGLYYSGGIDWLYHDVLIRSFGDLARAVPRSDAYLAYATAHWRELIDRYRPCSMWNDIGFPGPMAHLDELIDHYYATVPDGVVNDRFKFDATAEGLVPRARHDFTTPEYQSVPEIQTKKWEACRGIGSSFGYNRAEGPEHYLTPEELITSFVDIVSKNGNLLLNVGPTGEGEIPELQAERLRALGAWLAQCGDAVFATRPWTRAEGRTRDGLAVRFTSRGQRLHAIVLGSAAPGELALEGLAAREGTRVARIGAEGRELPWKQADGALVVSLDAAAAGPAFALCVDPAPADLAAGS